MSEFQAALVEMDQQDRTITVRFEQNGEVGTYPLSEDAEIVQTDGVVEEPMAMTELVPGIELALEFGGIEGETTLRKLTHRDMSEG